MVAETSHQTISRSGEGLTSFNKDNSPNLSGESKVRWSFTRCLFFFYAKKRSVKSRNRSCYLPRIYGSLTVFVCRHKWTTKLCPKPTIPLSIVSLIPATPKIAGLSCDEIHVLLWSGEALANDPVGFADRACENLFEPVEMLTVHPSYHGFSVNHQAFHTACYQMRADVARWTGTAHKQGVGIL